MTPLTNPCKPTINYIANYPTKTPTNLPTEAPINSPTDFPINSRINIINHRNHGGKHGIVCRHTTQYVTVEISNMTTTTQILPKFLQLRTNATQTFIPLCNHTSAHQKLSMPKAMKKKKSEEPNDDDTKWEHTIYDRWRCLLYTHLSILGITYHLQFM